MDFTSIQSVGPIRPSSPKPFETDQVNPASETFGDILKKVVNDVNDKAVAADAQVFSLATGDVQDVQQVILAMEKASLSMQLVIEIRDRVLEAFNTLMRTSI